MAQSQTTTTTKAPKKPAEEKGTPKDAAAGGSYVEGPTLFPEIAGDTHVTDERSAELFNPSIDEHREKFPEGVTREGENDDVDMTNIVHGKKINPVTGTQTSEDDPNGVFADNVYNEVQIEHASHTITQTEPGADKMMTDTFEQIANDDDEVDGTLKRTYHETEGRRRSREAESRDTQAKAEKIDAQQKQQQPE